MGFKFFPNQTSLGSQIPQVCGNPESLSQPSSGSQDSAQLLEEDDDVSDPLLAVQ